MKLFGWRWLAVSSMMAGAMMAGALAAKAETRPQYGGVLHVAMRAAPATLNPADLNMASHDLASYEQQDSIAQRSLMLLMFDTLVTTDESGRIQPGLATSWQVLASNQARNESWEFRIRRGIRFHDGTPLSAEMVAASLHAANPAWNVRADADSVVIERDGRDPAWLAELALPRNAIAKASPEGAPRGTGPFHVVDWQPAKKLTLAAEENCWRGRPFLDGIEIEMGESFRDQMTALEQGKADLVEVAPEQARQLSLNRTSLAGRQVRYSAPAELLALVFMRDVASADEKLLREALAWSVERGSIRSVLLQGAGQPAASILPTWMSGYGFVFSTDADLPRARQARQQVRTISTWSLGYDGDDPLDRLLAERIALNAKDAGLSLQPMQGANPDVRLMRIPLASADPWIGLNEVAKLAGTPAGKESGSAEELYAAETALLATRRVIPLFHLPVSYAAAGSLKRWTLRPDGSWNLGDAWLEAGKR
jgi:peptide/nickel transport system substrate-binding protein